MTVFTKSNWSAIPFVIGFACVYAVVAQTGQSAAEFDGRQVIVKFKEKSSFLLRAKLSVSTPSRIQRFVPVKPDMSQQSQPVPGGVERIFVAQLADGADLQEILWDLNADPDVEYAEPDYIGYVDGSASAVAARVVEPQASAPADPLFGLQWGLQNSGQIIGGRAGKPGIDVNAIPAWDITKGDSNTILAVLDTGIALGAADFAGRILPGYDYANNDSDPADDHGHGTNVASIAAASGGNGTGIAGMNWRCRILPLKIYGSNGGGNYSWWVSALIAAAEYGAKVINMSAGGTSASSALADAVTYAQARGAIVVASMMNTDDATPSYPAAYPGVIAVGAIDNTGARAVPFCYDPTTGSNYGSHIAVVAPGEMILGLNYLNPWQASYWCGTSQATPFVSGLVSLMFAINPRLTAEQVYSALKAGARDLVGPSTEDTPGWDRYFGWGLIDAYKSLMAVEPADSLLFPQIAFGGGYSTTFTILNPGSDATSGILALIGERGEPLNASFSVPGLSDVLGSVFQITVPPGGVQFVTASAVTSGDATKVGWARVKTSGGSPEGVATYQLMNGTRLGSAVGVLSSSTASSATVPIDDDCTLGDQSRATGYAVANPGNENIDIKLVLVNANGSVYRTIAPPSLNPLPPGSHVARFLWQDLNDPGLKFRGSLVMVEGGKKAFSAVALMLNQGLYTAIPVVSSAAPGIP